MSVFKSKFFCVYSYNIRYGHPNASDKDIENAAMVANVHETILSFPQGIALTNYFKIYAHH